MAKQVLLLQLVVVWTQFSLQVGDECGFANIYITNDDGSEQVFTVKHMASQAGLQSSCPNSGSSAPTAGNPGSASTGPTESYASTAFNLRPVTTLGGLLADINRPIGPPHSLHPAPIIGLVVWNAFFFCDKLKNGDQVTLCYEVKKFQVKGAAQCSLTKASQDKIKELAAALSDAKLLPATTDDETLDRRLANGLVLLSLGMVDASISHFSSIIKKTPNVLAAYYFRGLAYVHKGIQAMKGAALQDFSTALEMDPSQLAIRELRAQVLLMMHRFSEARDDVEYVLKSKKRDLAMFIRGTIKFLLNDLLGAEKDLRHAAQMEGTHAIMAHYNLALVLYYRGRITNAVEALREIIKVDNDNFEAHLALTYCYRELGDLRRFRLSLNTTLKAEPGNLQAIQLRAHTLYRGGFMQEAYDDIEKCLSLDQLNMICLFLDGLFQTNMGHLYPAIMSYTKTIVYNPQSAFQLSPEFIQAHYLREYSRFLHHKLDSGIDEFDPDAELSLPFRANWMQQSPFILQDFEGFPGIQPHIPDVEAISWSSLPTPVQNLLCKAINLGHLNRVPDGQIPRLRISLAMGLATLHVAQIFQEIWSNSTPVNLKSQHTRLLHTIAKYRQLADPETPMVTSHTIPNFSTDFHFIHGHSINSRLDSYFELVFKLVKTMLYHQSDPMHMDLKHDLQHIYTADDLLKTLKRDSLPDLGISFSMHVPSHRDPQMRLQGGIIILGMDRESHMGFSVKVPSSAVRSAEFHAEISEIYLQLHNDVQHIGTSTDSEALDHVVDTVLTILYYIYNWVPVTQDSGLVAYTLAMSLLMSVGKEVTGRIPPGKMLEMEALLSGTPDAFIQVTKQWMNIKPMDSSVSDLPLVSEVLPNVRNILEVLNLPSLSC